MANTKVQEPFPISCVSHRYLLFDIDTITHVRREYNMCGVLAGTLPTHPQQNVFLGIPCEILPEEARLLVEKGVAYIVDDVVAHKQAVSGLNIAERVAYQKALEKQGVDASKAFQREANERKVKALEREAEKKQRKRMEKGSEQLDVSALSFDAHHDTNELFFEPSPRPSSPAYSTTSVVTKERFFVTPMTSHHLLSPNAPSPSLPLPEVPPSYPLFAHLATQGYFVTPGLRFGCQYTVYPGDPLRYHSHFLANGFSWEEEFDVNDLIGGGRLGTGVKKALMIGGKPTTEHNAKPSDSERAEDGVRAFCIEWAGM
ncbi:tRNA-splicing endonuclease subunit Sen34 [Patellaria atrata CBS 101060]|uniref:tRNA-splicing endonuclease subunit Sen34 n=1 Tax=Patellaria atrata CBS 101060 TaxID=1346257 RepID=A0A9P4VQZ8_9PEZI|nr:tRNA-splicing endonuclease subunit Sen34 [Patellaria atrata CBS 101060]